YRRFFDISDLVGVRMEHPAAFAACHRQLLRRLQEESVTGLRVDHIDGLLDPLDYLKSLQGRPAQRFYIVVEKILSGDERLPQSWPVAGTTGYEFTNALNGLFVDPEGVRVLEEVRAEFTGNRRSFTDIVYECKRQVLAELFPADVASLTRRLSRLAGPDRPGSPALRAALTAVTACLPVYRTYVRTLRVSAADRRYLETAFREAQRREPALSPGALDLLRQVLFRRFPPSLSPRRKKARRDFLMRWQQLTGAVMAKGVEDTALYRYGKLLSLNEVGGDPAGAGCDTAGFHRFLRERGRACPHTLNATATHDTKRSEDIRARLNVLSEIPREWQEHVRRWQRWHEPHRITVGGMPVPKPEMLYFLYQTLVGAWPLAETEIPGFRERLKAYVRKAAREAKTRTSWLNPRRRYEDALDRFLDAVLADRGADPFPADFHSFREKIAFSGALNSLSQVLLKITAPGVPDFYQGTELWDFSLVDPDNRRPVDFSHRARVLAQLSGDSSGQLSLARELLDRWRDGNVKLYVTCRALSFRRENPALFRDGEYLPLSISGDRESNLVAFARRRGQDWALTIVPRLTTRLSRPPHFPLGEEAWGKDRLLLPAGAPAEWRHIYTGEKIISPGGKGLTLAQVLGNFPVALLAGTGTTAPRPIRR
ncbi:MAG: malto-oligosyltrehalose synthase, partial [Chloroflexota bacterium]